MQDKFDLLTEAHAAELDERLAAHGTRWWDAFYENRARPCPFFGTAPDESLATWLNEGVMRPGRALELGCGNGRNAIFLASRGFVVNGVDYSPKAIDWARSRSLGAGLSVCLECCNVFDLNHEPASYDLVYDSGCFHHIPPHRRRRYVELVVEALKPGGWFGLACFTPEGGSGYSDDEVYARCSLGGGLGFTEDRLREIWSGALDVRVIRQMIKTSEDSGLFGENFLWALLAQKQ